MGGGKMGGVVYFTIGCFFAIIAFCVKRGHSCFGTTGFKNLAVAGCEGEYEKKKYYPVCHLTNLYGGGAHSL
jgi:hypothetical protein